MTQDNDARDEFTKRTELGRMDYYDALSGARCPFSTEMVDKIMNWHESEKKRWLESILPEKKCFTSKQLNEQTIEYKYHSLMDKGFDDCIDEIKKNGGIV